MTRPGLLLFFTGMVALFAFVVYRSGDGSTTVYLSGPTQLAYVGALRRRLLVVPGFSRYDGPDRDAVDAKHTSKATVTKLSVKPTNLRRLLFGELCSVPAPKVLCFGDHFEMVRIDATRISTEVVQDKSLWNYVSKMLIEMSMGTNRFPVEAKDSVLLAIKLSLPVPATCLFVDLEHLMGAIRKARTVARNEANRLSRNPTSRPITFLRDRGCLATSTHAQAGWVGSGPWRCAANGVPPTESYGQSGNESPRSICLRCEWCRPTAAAHAQARRIRRINGKFRMRHCLASITGRARLPCPRLFAQREGFSLPSIIHSRGRA